MNSLDKYTLLLEKYERDLADLKKKESQIPKENIITREDERRVIKEHFEEEQALERRLGRNFLTSIDEENDYLGSTLEGVSRKMNEENAIDNWVTQVTAEAKKQK